MDYYTKEEIDKIIEDAINKAVETALMSLPLVVRNLVGSAVRTQDLAKKFYEDNKDLSTNRPFVASVIEQVEADNPGKPYEDVLKLAAIESRRRMSIKDNLSLDVKRPSLTDLDESVNGAI
jgi:hypothetical protein